MKASTKNIILTAAVALGLGATSVGCGGSKSGSGSLLQGGNASAATTAASTSAGAAGAAANGAGVIDNNGNVATGDVFAPDLTVTSPARATFTTDTRLNVTGSVSDQGSGVAEVHVNGRRAQLSGDTYNEPVDLTPGLNTIVIEAWDKDNNRTEKHVSVISGTFANEDDMLDQASAIRVEDAALDFIEPSIAQSIERQKPQIVQQVLAGSTGDTKIKGFDFGQVTASIDAAQGGVRFDVRIASISMPIEHKARILLIFRKTKRGTVRAGEVRLQGFASITVQNGSVVAQVQQVNAVTTGFSVPDWASSERNNIKRKFEQSFATNFQTQLQSQMDSAFQTTASSGTVNKTALGIDFAVDWELDGLNFDEAGATATFKSNVSTPTLTYGAQVDSVRTGAPLVALGRLQGATTAVAVHQDVLNRGLHAAWRSGMLNTTITQQTLTQNAPNSTLVLDTSLLIAQAPILSQFVAPGQPLELQVEGRLPAVIDVVDNAQNLMVLRIGDLKVATVVVDPATGARTTLADAVYSLSAEIGLVEQNGLVRMVPMGNVEVHVDVVGQALPGTEELLEQLAQAQAPGLFQQSLQNMAGVAIPAVKGFTATNLQFVAAGDSLVVTGNAATALPTRQP